MGIFKKVEFEPNCEKLDDGNWYCKPVLKEGDIIKEGKAVIRPTGKDFELVKYEGPAEILPHLEKHFQERKLV